MTDRNAEAHFGQVETTDIKRSIFPLEFRNLSTCNAGDLIPFLAYSDLLPGDTIKCSTSAVVRMTTPLNPTMDDLFVDTYYFLIPHRIVWDHWQEFMGVTDNGWTASTQYQVPLIHAPVGTGVTKGTIADYMGIPKGVTGIDYQALPFRAYVKTYNTWFRNSSLIAPVQLHTDDTDRNGDNTVAELGGAPLKASRIADYLSSCLPEPQKPIPGFSGGMTIPLGTSAPIVGNGKTIGVTNGDYNFGLQVVGGGNGSTNFSTTTYDTVVGTAGGTGGFPSAKTLGLTTDGDKSGMIADLTNATAATINALRLSFQIQKLFELRARTGTGRYFDVLKGEFGTAPNTSVLQEPEYLGGKREPLNLTQVVQNSSTTGSGSSLKELGMTGGMSHTVFSNEDFTKSITEHSILLGIMCIRQYHTYQQGLDRMWSRRDKLDYYTPLLAHLGEMPRYKKEIYASGTSTDNQVWGYNEAWSEYKYGKHIVTGEMNSTYAQSLDVWHYADYYANAPTLAQNWIEEIPNYIDRTLAVAHTTSDQFKFDIITNIIATRPMPVYCTPGLIDHF